jgi:hypothetical protein
VLYDHVQISMDLDSSLTPLQCGWHPSHHDRHVSLTAHAMLCCATCCGHSPGRDSIDFLTGAY